MKFQYNTNVTIEEYEKYAKNLNELVKEKLKLREKLLSCYLIRKSLDARKKPKLYFNLKFIIEVTGKDQEILLKKKTISHYQEIPERKLPVGQRILAKPPVIVGSGPAGLFCAYQLALNGFKPIIIEQGAALEKRIKIVDEYITQGIFKEGTNIAFGEGGAGTFSDAKLTSRSKNPLLVKVLETLVEFGAAEEILYVNNPHLGTDGIRKVVLGLREKIIELGGEFYFETRFLDFQQDLEQDFIRIETDKGMIESGLLVLAIGHSSRATTRRLLNKGLPAKAKGFSVGFRIEHKATFINKSQYGRDDEIVKKLLGNSDYHLTYKGEKGVYSFCMCPGGYVVPSNSNKEEIVTNGMSYSDRGGELSNSAIVATVNSEDFGDDPFEALAYQERIEKEAYKITGQNYKALGQNATDFIEGKASEDIKVDFQPSYKPGITLGDFNQLLPKEVSLAIKGALLDFNRKLPGFIKEGFLTGPETRTSSPIQFSRDELNKVLGYNEVYAIGEGAGFAGGIVSSAIDGLRTGENIILEYRGLGE